MWWLLVVMVTNACIYFLCCLSSLPNQRRVSVFSVSADAFILGCGRNLFPSPPPPPPPTQKKREVGKRRTFLYSQSFRLDSFFFSFLFLPATTTRTHATEWPIQRPTRITSIDFDFLTFPLWIVKKIFNPPPIFLL